MANSRMFRKILGTTLVVFCLAACTGNILRSSADETTDAALYIDALRAIGQKNYSVAITKIGEMSVAMQAERGTLFLLASAYAGQCGLEFVGFTEAFNDADFSSVSLFTFVLEYFQDSQVANQAACISAEATYDLITTELTPADSLNKVYLGFAKIGVVLNKANLLKTGNNTFDSGGSFDLCESGDLSDEDVAQVITGFSRIITGAADAGLGSAVPSCPGGVDCTKTNVSSVIASDITDFRVLLSSPVLPGMTGPGGLCP